MPDMRDFCEIYYAAIDDAPGCTRARCQIERQMMRSAVNAACRYARDDERHDASYAMRVYALLMMLPAP